MASWVYASVQTHQTVHIKYMRFFVHQLNLSKAVKGIIKLRVSHQPPWKKNSRTSRQKELESLTPCNIILALACLLYDCYVRDKYICIFKSLLFSSYLIQNMILVQKSWCKQTKIRCIGLVVGEWHSKWRGSMTGEESDDLCYPTAKLLVRCYLRCIGRQTMCQESW